MPDNKKPIKVHYIHKLNVIVQKRIVGVFVLSAILVIVGLILLQIQSSHLLDDRIIYHAYLANAQGVSTETLINVSGIEVGQVKAIDITSDNKIHVTFFVYDSFQRLLRTDSTGELNKLSVIGNAFIIIKAGSHQLPILPANSTIPIEEPVSVDDLMAELTPAITSLKEIVENVSSLVAVIEPDKLKTFSQDLSVFMANLVKVSEQLTSGKGAAGKVLFDEGLEQDITFTIGQFKTIVKDIDLVVKDSAKAMIKVDDILSETQSRVKEVKLLIQPATELAQKSNDIALDVAATTRIVDKEVKQLPDMVNKMQNLLDSTNRTLQNAQQVWPLSTIIPAENRDTLIKDQPLDD